ncbi:MAG: DUF2339 domain-containing protein [Magnetospiraceae bacterium]
MDEYVFYGLLAFLIFVVAPILGVIGFFQGRTLKQRLRALEQDIALLRQRVEATGPLSAPAPQQAPAPEPEPVEDPVLDPMAEPAPPLEEIAARIAAQEKIRAAADLAQELQAARTTEETEEPKQKPAAPKKGFEERLTGKWFVWLGGATLAFAGILLGRYVIEQGLLGPLGRMILGIVVGLALVAGGEWLRRRPSQKAIAALSPDYIPPALSSGGIVAVFASVYAGYAFADLLNPSIAFVFLAVAAVGAIGLALLQGPVLAAIGLTGAYMVPFLVSTGNPQPWVLFPYLFFVTFAGLAIVRHLAWRWLAYLCLIGGLGWVFLWYGAFYNSWIAGDAIPIALYLALSAAAAAVVREAAVGKIEPATDKPLLHLSMAGADVFFILWMLVTNAAAFGLLRMDQYGWMSVLTLGLIGAGSMGFARRRPDLEVVPLLSAVTSVLALAAWHLPTVLYSLPENRPWEPFGPIVDPVIPPELVPFVLVSGLCAALYWIGGQWGTLWGARRYVWGTLATAVPVLTLVIAYWRIEARGVDYYWLGIGLALAAVYVASAAFWVKKRFIPGMDHALALNIVGAFAGIAFALTMGLERSWLTVGLALLVPGFAWIDRKLDLSWLRWPAMVLALAVGVRMVMNNDLIHLPDGLQGIAWLAYGYLIPAAAFRVSWVWFRRQKDDVAITILRAGTVGAVMLFLSLSLRHGFGGDVFGTYTLLESGLQSVVWGLGAVGMLQRTRTNPDFVSRMAWPLFGILALINLILFPLGEFHPLTDNEWVGEYPLFNILTVAYGLPAVVCLLLRWQAKLAGHRKLAAFSGILALFLLFMDLSLEVTRAFHGPVLVIGPTTTAEWFAYSIAWLIYAGALLATALWRDIAALRWASLVVVMLTVCKVFLFDLSELEGLYRIASFMGLGLSLVAIGFLYQRFVFPHGKPDPEPETGEADATPG